MQNNDNTHLVLASLMLLVIANLSFLNIKVFSPVWQTRVAEIATENTENKKNEASTLNQNSMTDACPASCLSLINQATQSAARTGSLAENQTTSQYTASTPKEIYIPLGSGQTRKNEWTDLTATETLIDPGNYGMIKEAYFIASLRNPTKNGQVEAQLYNVTDKHMVWGSHIIMTGVNEQTITSQKITLDKGSKLYRVMIKSGMEYQAYLDNAKVRIMYE